MSETHVTEIAQAQSPKTGGPAPATSLRFTPLRSDAVTRKGGHEASAERIVSRLVPLRRVRN